MDSYINLPEQSFSPAVTRMKISRSHSLSEQGHTQGEPFIPGPSTIITGRNCHPFCLGVRRNLNKPFLYYNLAFIASEKGQSLKSNFVILHSEWHCRKNIMFNSVIWHFHTKWVCFLFEFQPQSYYWATHIYHCDLKIRLAICLDTSVYKTQQVRSRMGI